MRHVYARHLQVTRVSQQRRLLCSRVAKSVMSGTVHPQILPNISNLDMKARGIQLPTETDLLKDDFFPAEEIPDWLLTQVNLTALAYAACTALSTNEIPKITLDTDGGYNRIFLLFFEKLGKTILARVPLKNGRSSCQIASAVATMSFARHVQGIPTPEIFAWNNATDNLVGAPYILQEYFSDVVEPWEIFGKGSDTQRTLILEELARYHAAFLAPFSPALHGTGRLSFAPNLPPTSDLSDPRTYTLLPRRIILSRPWEETQRVWSSTTTCLGTFWKELQVVRHNMAKPDNSTLNLDEIGLGDMARAKGCDLVSFAKAASHARRYIRYALARLREAPADLAASCLFRGDYAFRNVLLDAETLRVRAFIDWDDVYVKPFILSVNFPEDFRTFTREGLDPHSTYYRDGAFGVLPPEEDGQILDVLDETGNYRETDEHGNRLYICERNERIRDTARRREYIAHLKKYDSRVGRSGTWELRKDMLRAEYLVERGGEAWWDKRKWLKQQMKALRRI